MTSITVQTNETDHQIKVQGNLDNGGSMEIRGELLDLLRRLPRTVNLDVADVSLLTSAGIRVLIEAAKVLLPSGSKISLRNPQPFVSQALKTSGLQSLIGVTA